MTSKLAVVSVQHTGTHFIAKLFRWPWAALNEQPSRDVIHVGHISRGQLPHIKTLAKRAPLVMPMRHPYVVAEAWKRRGRPLNDLVQAFRLMHEEVLPLNPLVVAIDSNKREQQLQAVSDAVGVEIATDWQPKNSKTGTHDMQWRDISPEPDIEGLARYMSKFLGRFY